MRYKILSFLLYIVWQSSKPIKLGPRTNKISDDSRGTEPFPFISEVTRFITENFCL